MVQNPMKLDRKLTFKPGDRLFAAINDLTILMAALGHALHAIGGSGRIPEKMGVMRMRPSRFSHAIALPLVGPLQIAMKGEVPDIIDVGLIALEDAQSDLVGEATTTSGFNHVLGHLVKPVFLAFFERYNVWLTENLGDAVNWPATLNFARVVRNAIAHGSINIRTPSTPPVVWRGLSYSHADSGRDIFSSDIGPTDLIGLMIEADWELDAISAPIL